MEGGKGDCKENGGMKVATKKKALTNNKQPNLSSSILCAGELASIKAFTQVSLTNQ